MARRCAGSGPSEASKLDNSTEDGRAGRPPGRRNDHRADGSESESEVGSGAGAKVGSGAQSENGSENGSEDGSASRTEILFPSGEQNASPEQVALQSAGVRNTADLNPPQNSLPI